MIYEFRRASLRKIHNALDNASMQIQDPRPGARTEGEYGTSWPSSSLLGRLSKPAASVLLSAGNRLSFRAGETLMMQGGTGSHALLLLSGLVKVTANLADGREALLAVRLAGDLVGEMACLTGESRSAAVVAAGEVIARHLPAVTLLQIMRDQPDVAIETCRMIALRLRWANDQRLDLALRSADERVASVLVRLGETYGRQDGTAVVLDIRLSQAELASLTGLSQRATEKALHDLHGAGMVDTGYRSLTIDDLAGLRSVAGLPPRSPQWDGVL